MIVSENEVYQIVKKSCVSEKIYEDWADDIGKAIAFLQKNYKDGCEEFKNLIYVPVSKDYITIKQERNQLTVEDLNPIQNAIPIIDWLISGQNKKNIVTNQIISPLIFFSLLAKTSENYGGTFKISNEKKEILYEINANFEFFKIDKLKGYFIIEWFKSKKFINPNNANKHLHNVKKETWEYLSQKAYSTYVPETTVSRNSGAGAGLLDND